jgi:ArsR family transcriptional regulator
MSHIEISKASQIHAALADPLRIRILRLLLERELCVCEIIPVVKEPQYKVSRHLAVMKKAGLVRDWKDGTWVHYPEIFSCPEIKAPSRVLSYGCSDERMTKGGRDGEP